MLSMVSATNLKSTVLAAATHSPIGTPDPLVNKLRLVPLLARSVGFGPVFFPTERRFGHCAIERLPVPFDAFKFVIFFQTQFPQPTEYPGFRPFLKSSVGARRSTNSSSS